jgi:hypothetical protein
MNQTAIKLASESSISGESSNNVISLSKVRMHQRTIQRHRNNMIKQRLIGCGLFAICWTIRIMTGDCLVLLIFGAMALDMVFNPKYIMKFNTKR